MRTIHQERIENFMRLAGQVILTRPTIPTIDVRLLRAKLILEEAFETVEALGVRVYHELIDDDVGMGYGDLVFAANKKPNLIEIADGCADVSVVTIGTLSACGIEDVILLEEVDESNLRKFGPGSYMREDGKWMKPPDWKPPNIQEVFDTQIPEDRF